MADDKEKEKPRWLREGVNKFGGKEQRMENTPRGMLDAPPQTSKVEWIKTNTLDCLNMFELIYGTIEHDCTPEKCPKMRAGPKFEYLWAEDEYVGRPTHLPAREYTQRLIVWAKKIVEDESLFPPEGTDPPSTFQSSCSRIWGRIVRVVMHVYWHHWDTVVSLDEEELVNVYTEHFVAFALKHNLLPRAELVAPILPLLHQILPERYKDKLRLIEEKDRRIAKKQKEMRRMEREKKKQQQQQNKLDKEREREKAREREREKEAEQARKEREIELQREREKERERLANTNTNGDIEEEEEEDIDLTDKDKRKEQMRILEEIEEFIEETGSIDILSVQGGGESNSLGDIARVLQQLRRDKAAGRLNVNNSSNNGGSVENDGNVGDHVNSSNNSTQQQHQQRQESDDSSNAATKAERDKRGRTMGPTKQKQRGLFASIKKARGMTPPGVSPPIDRRSADDVTNDVDIEDDGEDPSNTIVKRKKRNYQSLPYAFAKKDLSTNRPRAISANQKSSSTATRDDRNSEIDDESNDNDDEIDEEETGEQDERTEVDSRPSSSNNANLNANRKVAKFHVELERMALIDQQREKVLRSPRSSSPLNERKPPPLGVQQPQPQQQTATAAPTMPTTIDENAERESTLENENERKHAQDGEKSEAESADDQPVQEGTSTSEEDEEDDDGEDDDLALLRKQLENLEQQNAHLAVGLEE